MAKLTIHYGVDSASPKYNGKPYREMENEVTRKLPGVLIYESETNNTMAFGLTTIYKVVYECTWFVEDMEIIPTFKEHVVDDGSGVKIPYIMLTDMKITKKHRFGINPSIGRSYNPFGASQYSGPTSSSNGFCNHEYVNVGFHLPSYACKHCGKAK